MNNKLNRPYLYFWIISILVFLWNLIGVFAYFSQSFIDIEDMKSLSESEKNYFFNLLAWVTAAFALAVFAGFFGAVCLLLRKKNAFPLFLFSLITLIIQQIYNLFIQDDIEITGLDLIYPVTTIFVGIF